MHERQSEEKIIDFVKASLISERYTSAIYLRLGELYVDSLLSRKLFELGKEEGEHANFWVSFLERRGISTGNFGINRFKVLILSVLYRILGIGLTLKILEIGEHNAIRQYSIMLKDFKIDFFILCGLPCHDLIFGNPMRSPKYSIKWPISKWEINVSLNSQTFIVLNSS